MIYLLSWYSYIFLIPAIIFSIYASVRVKTTFAKYSKQASKADWTASDMSRMVLERYKLSGVSVQRVRGSLTDNYDPRSHTLNLSDTVYSSNSIAALGVAAHEAGHAIQHNVGYTPFRLRSVLVPVTNYGSLAALPLLVIGVFIELLAGSAAIGNFGTILVLIGIIGYAMTTVFALVTLPVEINASRRAGKMLAETGVLDGQELAGAKQVLSAAALTYVAALAVSLMSLVRLLWILSKVRKR